MRTIIALSLLFATALLIPPPAAAADTPAITQRQWMIALVEGLGWSFGLPDQPEDGDYQSILDGDRTLRIEAEVAKDPADLAATMDFRNYGDFSGPGWLNAIAAPTTVRLNFLLPWSGVYRLTTSLRLPGHRIDLGGREFSADGGDRFTELTLGEVELAAGAYVATVHLPPSGSIDYLELTAPPLLPVRPVGVWDLDRPLTLDIVAETAARALLLEPALPPTYERTDFEAEAVALPGKTESTDVSHLGAPSGGRWLRAGPAPTPLSLVFTPPAPGVYNLVLRGASSAPVSGSLNSRYTISAPFPPYLQTITLGGFYLEAAENRLDLLLPPRCGVDLLRLEHLRSDGAAYRHLLGLPADAAPTPEQLDRLLALLAAIGVPR